MARTKVIIKTGIKAGKAGGGWDLNHPVVVRG